MSEKKSVLELHPKQGKAFLSDSKVTLCAAGIQSGKTTVGSLWFRRQASKWSGRDNNFLVAAPTYKIMKQSTLPAFLRTMHGTGVYRAKDEEFVLRSGGTVFLRTSTDPFSVEGIPNVRAAWMDEAGKCKYMFWVNVEGRCARTNAPIMCTTTPYAMNWPYTELIRPTDRKERDDVAYFQWKSLDNPSFSKEYYDRQKQLLDPIRFSMKYEGVHAKRYGLVYPITDGATIDPYNLESGSIIYGGIDWGFTDPLVFILRALTPMGKDVQFKEFYKPGIFPDEIPQIAKQLQDTFNVKLFLADPSDPGKIAMLQKHGIRVQAADNDIRKGIDAHNKAIRSGKHQIFSDQKATLDEYETYHWPDEDDEGLDAEDKPVDENNHAMDATRYISLYLESMGFYDDKKPRIIESENKVEPKLQYTHIPAWQRKRAYDKKFEDL